MSGGLGLSPVPDLGIESWHVRLRDAGGAILGAGMLVGSRHVLTCAHVVAPGDHQIASAPDIMVNVDLIGLPDAHSASAKITPGCWVPPKGDDCGDIALLECDRPHQSGATLRRVAATWDRIVHTHGFPDDMDIGVWARTTLAGPVGAGGERVQMDLLQPGQPVRRGFSGAAVVDDITQDVIGMVVSAYTDDRAGLSWMIPVDAIVRYLPIVGEWVRAEEGTHVPSLLPLEPDAGASASGPASLDRLDEIADQVSDLERREAELRRTYRRATKDFIVPLAAVPTWAAMALGRHVNELRRQVPRVGGRDDTGYFGMQMKAVGSAAGRAAVRIEQDAQRLAALWRQHDELRGRLDGYHERAWAHGLVGNAELETVYREAYDALRRRPCDVQRAATLVRRYGDAGRTELGR